MDFMGNISSRTKDVRYVFNRNTPDPVQETQGAGYSKPMMQALSAVFVRSPDYGTRSVLYLLSTILLCLSPPKVSDRAVLGWRITDNREF